MKRILLPDWPEQIPIYEENDKPNWMFKILGKNFSGITWNYKIHKRGNLYVSTTFVRHEFTHVLDQKSLTFPIFLLIYCLNWIWNVIKMILFPITIPLMYLLRVWDIYFYVGHPYRNIMFERSAYYNQNDKTYLTYKKKHDYLNFIFKKKGGGETK